MDCNSVHLELVKALDSKNLKCYLKHRLDMKLNIIDFFSIEIGQTILLQ